jgi:hypothetical protein
MHGAIFLKLSYVQTQRRQTPDGSKSKLKSLAKRHDKEIEKRQTRNSFEHVKLEIWLIAGDCRQHHSHKKVSF